MRRSPHGEEGEGEFQGGQVGRKNKDSSNERYGRVGYISRVQTEKNYDTPW